MAYLSGEAKLTIGELIVFSVSSAGSTDWTLDWYCGSQAGTIVSRTSEMFVGFVPPVSLYNEIPDRTETVIQIEISSFKNGVYEGNTWYNYPLYINKSLCTPIVRLPNISEVNDRAAALTGDRSKFIRYISSVDVELDVEARNGATINAKDIVLTYNGVEHYGTLTSINELNSNVFYVKATDSRGLVTSIKYTIPAENFVEYIKLTCNAGNSRPDTHGDMELTCSGNYFNGSFGAVNNSLTVEYRYKETGGEFGAWATMTATISGNTYNATASLSGLDYQKTYEFECRATDKAMSISSDADPVQALPVFHWSKDDFVHETPVNFRAGILFNGVEGDYIEEQGTSGNWIYRKWHSGLAECWGRFTQSVSGSDWTAWGSLYQATILMNEDLPFSFMDVPMEYATLHGLSGGLLNSSALGMSSITTGAHFAVHPNKLTSTYGFILELYEVGRWK